MLLGFCMLMVFFLFLRQVKHFLPALLLLELVGVFFVLTVPLLYLLLAQNVMNSVLVILTMSACEASLGLAVLVYMMRSYGNDRMQSISVSSY